MRPTVDDETKRAGDIHPLEQRRLPGDLTGRDQHISAEDQRGADPTRRLDPDFDRSQAASLRST